MEAFSSSWTSWTTVTIITIIFYSYLGQRKNTPFVGNTWVQFFTRRSISNREVIKNAYDKYSKSSSAFWIDGPTGVEYILPVSALTEVRKAPDSDLDAVLANEDMILLANYLGMEYHDVRGFMSKYLNRSIPLMVPSLAKGVSAAIPEYFLTDPKTAAPAHSAAINAIGSITTKVFVGESYGNNQIWLSKVISFARGVTVQGLFLRRLPKWLIPLVAKRTPTATRVKELKEMLRPAVAEQVENSQKGQDIYDGLSADGLLLPMLVKYVREKPEYVAGGDERVLAVVNSIVLALLFAVIDTTAITFTHLLFDLVSHPHQEYADPMKAQVLKVLERHGGVWTSKSLSELNLMDSFIKESQRVHAIGLILSSRKVVSTGGYTFESALDVHGQPFHVPEGNNVQLPVWGVHTDPNNYPQPMEFQGFRFAHDAIPSSQPSEKFMSFGYGRHACPGRYMALTMMKLMIVELLLNCEWDEMTRPEDFGFGMNYIPNMSAKVKLRKKI